MPLPRIRHKNSLLDGCNEIGSSIFCHNGLPFVTGFKRITQRVNCSDELKNEIRNQIRFLKYRTDLNQLAREDLTKRYPNFVALSIEIEGTDLSIHRSDQGEPIDVQN